MSTGGAVLPRGTITMTRALTVLPEETITMTRALTVLPKRTIPMTRALTVLKQITMVGTITFNDEKNIGDESDRVRDEGNIGCRSDGVLDEGSAARAHDPVSDFWCEGLRFLKANEKYGWQRKHGYSYFSMAY
jgi:hypothetical protein